MELSSRLKFCKPSATLALNNRVNVLKKQGHPIINLTAGEPDFPTPSFIVTAAIEALHNGETRYTAVDGTVALKQAIIQKFQTQNHLFYTLEQVTVANGAKQIIYNALMATLTEGDEVIIPCPYWVSYPDMVALAGGVCKFIVCDEQNAFKLTPEQLKKVLSPKVKWLILNSPNNPTGAVYSAQELQALADVLIDYPHVLILSDDIYEHIVYDNVSFTTIAQVEPRLFDRTLTVNGMAKAYAMTGWRIGFAGGPSWLIEGMATLQSHSTSNPCSISQAASVQGLKSSLDFLKEHRAVFQYRRDQMTRRLNATGLLHALPPQGAFYIYFNCTAVLKRATPEGQILENDEDFCRFLLETAYVAGVPGSAFGLSPFVRFSYALDTKLLEDACQRIEKALALLRI